MIVGGGGGERERELRSRSELLVRPYSPCFCSSSFSHLCGLF